MTKGKILRTNPLPRPSSIGDIKGVLTNIEALNDLSATDVETEITKVATCTTNKITDAVIAHIDADISTISSGVFPVFVYNPVITDNFQAMDGAWERNVNASFWGGASLMNTNKAIDDRVGLGAFFIPVTGNYTLYIIYEMHNDKGSVGFWFNNVKLVEVDMYAVAQELNHRSTHALGELTKGLHILEVGVPDKNASSTDYSCRLMGLMIFKT